MAYTKVFAIRARLDDRIKYAVNGEKTELDERIVYTADPEKTDTVRFVTTLNCRSAETAFAAMQKTKKKYKKMGGVLGYHFIQSFAPGEVTPEQAHEIGCEFARRRLWAGTKSWSPRRRTSMLWTKRPLRWRLSMRARSSRRP